MTNSQLKGRQLYNPRGREPSDNVCLLADAIAAAHIDLFSQDNSVVLVANGNKVAVNFDMLREICMAAVVEKRVVNRDGAFEVAYVPVEPDHVALRAMLLGKTKAEGSLALRLPKAPSTRVLAPQIAEQVRDRLRRGEAAYSIATQLQVDVDVIDSLRGGAVAKQEREVPLPYREHDAAVRRQDGG